MNRSLVLLSGEGTTIPEAEARALFLTYDPASTFELLESRLLVARSRADPFLVGSRIAFSRRVGMLLEEARDAAASVRGRKVRLRTFHLGERKGEPDPRSVLRGVDGASVDLDDPDFEFTLVKGKERDYLALTSPGTMSQGWSLRRPRARPFFHPSAIFPKLSRAMVNLTRFKEGDVFLDPFAGTGSLALEAAESGAQALVSDQSSRMARGSLSNMKHYRQDWLGAVRADAFSLPLTAVDAIATDLPYGRASSTRGKATAEVARAAIQSLPLLLREGSRMVLMHPNTVEVGGSPLLAVEEEHHLYVHRLLTRTITVMRRR